MPFFSRLSLAFSLPPYSLPNELKLLIFGNLTLREISELGATLEELRELSSVCRLELLRKEEILPRKFRLDWDYTGNIPGTAFFACPFPLFQYMVGECRFAVLHCLEYTPPGIYC